MPSCPVVKAHAYGNDFLLVPASALPGDPADAARRLCDRHRGVGADGLILYEARPRGATMRLVNADGSHAEISGNGLRCLAALCARDEDLPVGASLTVETDAGPKVLELLDRSGGQWSFRAGMGQPTDVRQVELPVAGEVVQAVTLWMGNPQCIVLGPLPDRERFATLGRALATHVHFPAGSNVEFVHVEAPGRLRILIWERGVGPTSASGTGASASAVAAAAHGGASRRCEVVSPGGAQRVDWTDDGVFLTGSAEIVLDGHAHLAAGA